MQSLPQRPITGPGHLLVGLPCSHHHPWKWGRMGPRRRGRAGPQEHRHVQGHLIVHLLQRSIDLHLVLWVLQGLLHHLVCVLGFRHLGLHFGHRLLHLLDVQDLVRLLHHRRRDLHGACRRHRRDLRSEVQAHRGHGGLRPLQPRDGAPQPDNVLGHGLDLLELTLVCQALDLPLQFLLLPAQVRHVAVQLAQLLPDLPLPLSCLLFALLPFTDPCILLSRNRRATSASTNTTTIYGLANAAICLIAENLVGV
mmetsp:Transcript_73833/g.203780  ORF Transcript_73833/g.203780 Transcript_73833/m.203780 type:complete len:253 (-) Transcript_73833:80-838(-)